MITKEQAFGMYNNQNRRVIVIPKTEQKPFTGILESVKPGNIIIVYAETINGVETLSTGEFNINLCKLILRPLSDMTEEEKKKLYELRHGEKMKDETFLIYWFKEVKKESFFHANELEYLISIGIDIFNLKERDWAIYENELKGEGK